MPDLLPDIPSDTWNQWSASQFADAAGEKIASLGSDITSSVQQALAPPPPPAPAPPPPEPEPIPPPPPEPEPVAAPPPPPVAPPAPAPEQATPLPPPDLSTAAPPPMPTAGPDLGAAPTPAPMPAPTDISPTPDQTATPTPAPPTPSTPSKGMDFGALLSLADSTGANMSQFASGLGAGATGDIGAILSAADAAGADMNQFSSQLGPLIPPPVQQAAQGVQSAVQQGAQAVSSTAQGAFSQFDDLVRQNAGDLANDPNFIQTVIAGAKAESGLDPNAVQKGGGGRGLWQFDLGGMGKGLTNEQLFDPAYQASKIVPLYAAAYKKGQDLGMQGSQLASYAAGMAERPFDYENPQSAARRNYAQAYNDLAGTAKDIVQTGQTAINTVKDAASSAAARTSQFGMGLSSGDAMAFCGPAAAMAFAESFGRNPTVDEAKQLAQQVGWNAGQGMAGPSSEVALLNKLGIDTHMTQGVDWGQVAKDAASGNPVIIDTPGHYFYVDGYNAANGQFHFGSSATDLRTSGGKEWFAPDQLVNLGMGAARAAIFADHPLSGPGVAKGSTQSQSVGDWLGSTTNAATSAVSQKAQDTMSAVLNTGQDAVGGASSWLDSQKSKLSDAFDSAGTGAQDLVGKGRDLLGQVGTELTSPNLPADVYQRSPTAWFNQQLGSLGSDLTGQQPQSLEDLMNTPNNLRTSAGQTLQSSDNPVASLLGTIVQTPGVLDSLQTLSDLGQKYAGTPGATSIPMKGQAPLGLGADPSVMTPEDRQAYQQAIMAVGGLEQGELPKATPAFDVAGRAATTGSDLLQGAMARLSQYPDEMAAPIREAVEATRAPASDIAATLHQWMNTNPIEGAAGETATAAAPKITPEVAQALETLPAEDRAAVEHVINELGGGAEAAPTATTGAPATAPTTPTGAPAATPTTPTGTPTAPSATPTAAPPTPGGGGSGRAPRGGGTPTGGGGGGTPPPTGAPSPPRGGGGTPPTPSPTAPTPPPIAPPSGNIFSRFGQKIASVMSPTENLSAQGLPDAQNAIERYANYVGRNSEAANTIANSDALRYGLTPTGIDAVKKGLIQQETKQLTTSLRAQGLAVPVQPGRGGAPAGWRLGSDIPAHPLSSWAFDPRVVTQVRNVSEAGMIAKNDLGSAVVKATGEAKSTLFSLSNFHTMTEGLNAAFTSPETFANFGRAFFSDSFATGLRGRMASTFDDAARAGVTGLNATTSPDAASTIGNIAWKHLTQAGVGGIGGAASGYTEAKVAGKTDTEARQQALIGGALGLAAGGLPTGRYARGALPTGLLKSQTLPDVLNAALWSRAVPMAKATAWEGLTRGGMDAQVAARVVNERFGGLNYAAMGRNQTLGDASRLLVQAPDWTESTVRQLGSAMPFIGGAGQGQRTAFLAKAIGGMLATTEVANYALSGHSTADNQPGHQFEIEVRDPAGGFMHIGILPGNIQSFLNEGNKLVADPEAKKWSDIGSFVTGRAAEPAKLVAELEQTASSGGSALRQPYAVSKAGPIAGLLSTLAPVGISQVQQGTQEGGMNPGLATLMAVLGLNPRYSTAAAAAAAGASALPSEREPAPPREPSAPKEPAAPREARPAR